MLKAIWVDCPGIISDGAFAHSMRDGCTSCAPWWERIPICPECKCKLEKMGRTKCKRCNRFVVVEQDSRNSQ